MDDIITFSYKHFAKNLSFEAIGKKLPLIIKEHVPGDSFVFNIRPLIFCSAATAQEKGVYLYLASKRNYANYAIYGEHFLKTGWLDDNDLALVGSNRLLHLNNSKIYFYFEDTKNGY